MVRRPGYRRRKLYFTEEGMARLLAQDYHVSWRGVSKHPPKPRAPHVRNLATYGKSERKMRLMDVLYQMAQRYLDNPCAVPGCPCVSQSIYNVPQADYIRAMLEDRPSAYPKGGSYTKTGRFISHR